MKILLLVPLVLCAACVTPQATTPAASIKSTRIGSYEWTCKDPAGTLLKGSASQDAVFEVCANKALENPGVIFDMQGAHYTIVGTVTGAVIPPPSGDSFKLSWSASTHYTNGAPFYANTDPLPGGTAVTYEVYQWKYLGTEVATKVISTPALETNIPIDAAWSQTMCWCVVAVVNGVSSLQSNATCVEYGS